jgi:NhaP-type Na+/H+ or K+/H+ antiporter
MRRLLAKGIVGLEGAIALAALGAVVRGPEPDDSLVRDLAAGVIVVGIVMAVAWARAELELEGATDGN